MKVDPNLLRILGAFFGAAWFNILAVLLDLSIGPLQSLNPAEYQSRYNIVSVSYALALVYFVMGIILIQRSNRERLGDHWSEP